MYIHIILPGTIVIRTRHTQKKTHTRTHPVFFRSTFGPVCCVSPYYCISSTNVPSLIENRVVLYKKEDALPAADG